MLPSGQFQTIVALLALLLCPCAASTKSSQSSAPADRIQKLLTGPFPAGEIDQGPGIFEIDLTHEAPFRNFYTDEEFRFLESRRDELIPRLVARLEQDGSRLAAVLLACNSSAYSPEGGI